MVVNTNGDRYALLLLAQGPTAGSDMLEDKLTDILEESASKSSGPSPELLRQVWGTLVGRELAGVTRPEKLDDGILVVMTGSREWQAELEQRQSSLLRRIDGRLPWPVEALDLRVGDLPRVGKRPAGDDESADHDPTDVDIDQETEDALADVDPDIRGSLRRIRQHLIDERDE